MSNELTAGGRVTVDLFSAAIEDFMVRFGKSQEDVVQDICKRSTIFCSAKTRIASRSGVEAELKSKRSIGPRKVTNSRGRTLKAASQWQGTKLAAIVAVQSRRAGIVESPGRFYQRVEREFKKRKRSIGYWKAGWIPALVKFKARAVRKQRTQRFRTAVPGSASFRPKRGGQSIRGRFSNHARGLADHQPSIVEEAFEDKAAEMERAAAQEVQKDGKAAGFTVR